MGLNYMFIPWTQLSRLPVYTESGHKLGTIHDLEIDYELHSIHKYIVTHGITGLTKETFLVTPMQIISVSAEKIVVADSIIKDTGETRVKEVLPDPDPAI